MSHVRFTTEGRIARIILSRPDRRNALTTAMLEDLEAAAIALVAEPEVRAVILDAEGEDFSVGMDIAEMRRLPQPTVLLRRTAGQGARTMRAIAEIPQPVICAIQGVATGGAAALASACDFRVAASGARIGYGEVKLGINLMWQALGPLMRLVGPAKAKRLVMSGDLVPAETLFQWGFVDELADPGDLSAAALAMAEHYAALPPIAVQMVKRSVNALAAALDPAILHADTDQWLLAAKSADHREAVEAFLEKRAGRFKGD
ncbi:enoyl-CoA hydratase/isomerase family protein [Thermaurantiacus sp.]